ncbi:MAG: sporulation peptidase YabG [Beduini sp.]|uniref:sporulation peptidase YabG n=1 Tax=Beduini sp. TaxID=1922300 RepID=UPI0039A033FC
MKIGDLVVRIKYNRDIVFEIYDIQKDVVYLKGVEVRLVADSTLDDLEPAQESHFVSKLDESTLLRNDKVIRGKVLHLDGDPRYLKMCEEKYKTLGVRAVCIYLKEGEMKDQICELLEKHKPQILVITGHDSMSRDGNCENIDTYSHTRDYIEAVKQARLYESNIDQLVIFAGGCQSNYELLIAAGANFASSPQRKNIHALDPVYIAFQVANESVKNYVDVETVIKNTYNKAAGIGGIDTRGVARNIYPRRE